MRTTTKLALALVAGALALSACGGDDSSQEDDRAAITAQVDGINTAVLEKDGGSYCELLEPATFLGASTPNATFDTPQQCARETSQILKQAGEQPALEVESITLDGEDAALVAFTGRNGEARFVRVDGVWYLSLGATASSPEGAGGTTGTTGGEGG